MPRKGCSILVDCLCCCGKEELEHVELEPASKKEDKSSKVKNKADHRKKTVQPSTHQPGFVVINNYVQVPSQLSQDKPSSKTTFEDNHSRGHGPVLEGESGEGSARSSLHEEDGITVTAPVQECGENVDVEQLQGRDDATVRPREHSVQSVQTVEVHQEPATAKSVADSALPRRSPLDPNRFQVRKNSAPLSDDIAKVKAKAKTKTKGKTKLHGDTLADGSSSTSSASNVDILAQYGENGDVNMKLEPEQLPTINKKGVKKDLLAEKLQLAACALNYAEEESLKATKDVLANDIQIKILEKLTDDSRKGGRLTASSLATRSSDSAKLFGSDDEDGYSAKLKSAQSGYLSKNNLDGDSNRSGDGGGTDSTNSYIIEKQDLSTKPKDPLRSTIPPAKTIDANKMTAKMTEDPQRTTPHSALPSDNNHSGGQDGASACVVDGGEVKMENPTVNAKGTPKSVSNTGSLTSSDGKHDSGTGCVNDDKVIKEDQRVKSEQSPETTRNQVNFSSGSSSSSLPSSASDDGAKSSGEMQGPPKTSHNSGSSTSSDGKHDSGAGRVDDDKVIKEDQRVKSEQSPETTRNQAKRSPDPSSSSNGDDDVKTEDNPKTPHNSGSSTSSDGKHDDGAGGVDDDRVIEDDQRAKSEECPETSRNQGAVSVRQRTPHQTGSERRLKNPTSEENEKSRKQSSLSLFPHSNRITSGINSGLLVQDQQGRTMAARAHAVPEDTKSSMPREVNFDVEPSDEILSDMKWRSLNMPSADNHQRVREPERDVRPKTDRKRQLAPKPVPSSVDQRPEVANGEQLVAASELHRSRDGRPDFRSSTSCPTMHTEVERETSDALINHLSVEVKIPRCEPISDEIKNLITQEAQRHEVECCAIYRCPEHPTNLQIIGINAESMSFPGSPFMLKNCRDPRHVANEHVGSELFQVSKRVYNKGKCEYERWGESSCGLILVGDPSDNYNKYDTHYAVAPAHLILDNTELCDELLKKKNAISIGEVREVVAKQDQFHHYLLHLHSTKDYCDVGGLPLFSYRHFIRSSHPMWHQFTNDIALLKLEEYQLNEAGIPSIKHKDVLLASTRRLHAPRAHTEADFKEFCLPIGHIFQLEDPNTLKKMSDMSVKVFVQNDIGYMIPCGERVRTKETDGRHWTYAIDFVMPTRKFHHGDCGLIVYVQDRRGPTFYPFGMYTGKSLRTHDCCDRIVNTAVALWPCIKDIEDSYPEKVKNLRPMSNDQKVNAHKLIRHLSQGQTYSRSSSSPLDSAYCSGSTSSADVTETTRTPDQATFNPNEDGEEEEGAVGYSKD